MRRSRKHIFEAFIAWMTVLSASIGTYFGAAAVWSRVDLAQSSGVSVLARFNSGADSSSAVPDLLTVTIDRMGISAPVRPVGLDKAGNLEIPDETEVGWYEYGGAPGRAGATVLVAHVSWNNTTGPFYRLDDLVPGDVVEVHTRRGVQRYAVVERGLYVKEALPAQRVWRTNGVEELVLITCGGEFDGATRRYRYNVVVFATPVDADRL